MRVINLLLAGGIAMGALVLTAEGASAQADDCTVKCGCLSSGCGCSSDGGNGSECSASGNGCFVTQCETYDAEVFAAPDGSLLRRATVIDERGNLFVRVSRLAGAWEAVSPEVAVARDCGGVVVERFMTAQAAAAYRDRTRILAAEEE